jgi:hypothetical protein
MKKFYLILSACLLLANNALAFGSKAVKQPEIGGGIAASYAEPQPSHYTLIVAETVFDTATAQVTQAQSIFDTASVALPVPLEQTLVSESIAVSESAALAVLEQTAVSESIAVSGSAALTAPEQTVVSESIAVSESAELIALEQAAVSESSVVSESAALIVFEQTAVSESVSVSAAPRSMFGVLVVQDSNGLEYRPEIYENVGTDNSQEGWVSNNVRIYSYIIPANRQLSLVYEGAVGSQTHEFELNGSQTMQIKVSRNMADVERVATRYEIRRITRIITENITSTADLTAETPEPEEENGTENTAVALAEGDGEEYDENYEADDSGWNVDEDEYADAGGEEEEYEYVEFDEDADEYADRDEDVEYEYVEVDDAAEEYADVDADSDEYATAENEESEDEEELLAETESDVSANSELALAENAIVTRAVTETEYVPVTESYIAQEITENIEFTLASAENLNEKYALSLTEQDYYTLAIAEALYDDTPERKAHAFGRITVADEDDKIFTAQASNLTDSSRSGAFKNNARLRRYLIPVNTVLRFNYRSGNTTLSMIDCDELYPSPLLNYELDGTIGSLKVTRLEMNNNYVIHIRTGWGSADAGRPVRLVNKAVQ